MLNAAYCAVLDCYAAIIIIQAEYMVLENGERT